MLPKEIFKLSDGKEVINELESERSQKMSEFDIDLPNCWGETKSLRVIADISRAEPDVGDFGNGDISVTVQEVYCNEEGFDPN